MNRTETRVELYFDIRSTELLGAAAKERLHRRFGGRVSNDGWLRITCGVHRSQRRNREECLSRLLVILNQSLKRPKKRRPTRPSAGAQRRRMETKRRRARLKKLRRPVGREE